MKSHAAAPWAIACLVVTLSPGAYAVTIPVTTTVDKFTGTSGCSLRQAIEAANTDTAVAGCPKGEGKDTIEVPAGTYTITLSGVDDANEVGDFDITSDVDLIGVGAATTILSGGGSSRILDVSMSTGTLLVQGVTLRDGASPEGAAARIGPGASMTIRACVVRENEAVGPSGTDDKTGGGPGRGGALFNRGTLTVELSTLVANLARGGSGGSGVVHPSGGGGGAGMGGVLYNDLGAVATFLGSTLSGNAARGGTGGKGLSGGGGGAGMGAVVFAHEKSTTTLTNCTLSGNEAEGGDGGEFRLDHTLTEPADLGAPGPFGAGGAGGGPSGEGGYGGGGGAGLKGAEVLSGAPGGYGGGGGGAGVNGTGGMHGGDGGNGGGGGGAGLGGGLYVMAKTTTTEGGEPTVNVSFCTLASNAVNGGAGKNNGGAGGAQGGSGRGGAIFVEAGESTVNVAKSILVDTTGDSAGTDVLGPTVSGGFNIVGSGEGFAVPSDVKPGDPALFVLGSYGGTTETHAFTVGSVAINKVPASQCTETTDQRGLPRSGSCDAGAYEYNAMDLGDAPDSYVTLLAEGGPAHLTGPLFFGAGVDAEDDGAPSVAADGDDGAVEDGVSIPVALEPTVPGKIVVVASGAGVVDAWIDFDGDGSFLDAGEQVATALAVTAGPNDIPVTPPAGSLSPTKNAYARLRLSTAGTPTIGGIALDGEVVDLLLGCGDGAIHPQEECDDTNQVSGDGCTSLCKLEEGWLCPAGGLPCHCVSGRFGPACASTSWAQLMKQFPVGGKLSDFFGGSVAMTTTLAIVGAEESDVVLDDPDTPEVDEQDDMGAAYLFSRNLGGPNAWGPLVKLQPTTLESRSGFGRAVGIDGDTAAVGAPGTINSRGAVYIFSKDQGGANAWGLVKTDVREEEQVGGKTLGGRQGASIAVSGDRVVAGAPLGLGSDGAVVVFEKDHPTPGAWGKRLEVTTSDVVGGEFFGDSVALDGDTLVVGAPNGPTIDNPNQDPADPDDDKIAVERGQAFVFQWAESLGHWQQKALLGAQDPPGSLDPADGDRFGTSVAIDGDLVLVGAPDTQRLPPKSTSCTNLATGEVETLTLANDNSHKGVAYLYSRNAGGPDNWGLLKTLANPDNAGGTFFGISVAIDGDLLVVGAYGGGTFDDCGNLVDGLPGRVHVYHRHKGGKDNFGLLQSFDPMDPAPGGEFGRALAIRGDVMAVGARLGKGATPGSGSVFFLSPATCGDGVLAQSEECDDANDVDGDGCESCALTLGWACPVAGAACECGAGFKPVGVCDECKNGYEGTSCLPCPGGPLPADRCTGQGTCEVSDDGVGAKCNCQNGFFGPDCSVSGFPASGTIECSDLTAAPTLLGDPTCNTGDPIELDFAEAPKSLFCNDFTDPADFDFVMQTVRRTWSYDACGVDVTLEQTLTLQDTVAPAFFELVQQGAGELPTLEALALTKHTIECGVESVDVPVVVATDACDSLYEAPLAEGAGAPEGLLVAMETESDNQTCPETITRKWAAIDHCKNEVVLEQEIEVVDTTGPTISGVPADLTIECAVENLPLEPTLGAFDSCDAEPTVTMVETNPTNTPPACVDQVHDIVTRTWTATDTCNNQTPATQTITVKDRLAPVLDAAPPNFLIECGIDPIPSADELEAQDACAGVLPTVSVDTAPAGTCPSVITRTWTGVDLCGNSASVSNTITQKDTTPPVFQVCNTQGENCVADLPASLNVECFAEVPALSQIKAVDQCDLKEYPVTIVETDTGASACPRTITRTLTATDACGNTGTHVQTIVVEMVTEPTLVGMPADSTEECGSVPQSAAVHGLDVCDAELTATLVEVADGKQCPGKLTRTWSVEDLCGNEEEESQIIIVADTSGPVLDVPPIVADLKCTDGVPLPPTITGTDACEGNSFVDFVEVSDGPACPRTITRTWSSVDQCNNTSQVVQKITVLDNNAPAVNGVPADVTLECTGAAPLIPLVTVEVECDGQATLLYDEQTTGQTCPNKTPITETLTRCWTGKDNCNKSTVKCHDVAIQDTTSPVLAGVPGDTTVQCGEPLPDPPVVTVSDICDPNVIVTYQQSDPIGSGARVLTRTWSATDLCGNLVSASQKITVQDNTAPVMSGVPESTSTQCGAPPPPPTVTATDACDGTVTVSYEQTEDGQTCPKTWTRTWSVVDAVGNASSETRTVVVDDTEEPAINGVFPSSVFQCDSVPQKAFVTAADNCAVGMDLQYEETKTAELCPQTITRTWTVTDDCGNTTTETRVITAPDTTKPELTGVPLSAQVECGDVPAPGLVEASDNCDAAVSVPTFLQTGLDDDCPVQIVRTWEAADQCGNKIVQVQVLNAEDTINECGPAPCKNGGGCTDAVKAFICDCSTTGYEGDTCEIDIDECSLDTDNCHEQATCTNVPGSFECVCNHGWAGDGVQCEVTCGDAEIGPGENCDDANPDAGDGCSEACLQEFGYICSGEGADTCVSTCGDGKKASDEVCDDENNDSGDGCREDCQAVEFGYGCAGLQPSTCGSLCGDGRRASDEQCDDGGLTAEDGCSAGCTIEAGYTCVGAEPTFCVATCGSVFELDLGKQDWFVSGTKGAFQHGVSTSYQAVGFETVLNGALPFDAKDSTLYRRVAVPLLEDAPAPTLEIDYVLAQGNGTAVCLQVHASTTPLAADGDLLFETCQNTPNTADAAVSQTEDGFDRLRVPLSSFAGTTRTVIVTMKVDQAPPFGAWKGLFVDRIRVASDQDGDGELEFNAQWHELTQCDPCIDVDLDGYGRVGSAQFSKCDKGFEVDCNDDPDNGGDEVNVASTELCGNLIDDNCNGALDVLDSQCFEDCADGVDNGLAGGNALVDCADVRCANDPICVDPCATDYTFDSGPGLWATDNESLWQHVPQPVPLQGDGYWSTAGTGQLPSGHQLGRLVLGFAVPEIAQGGPKPVLEVVYRLAGDPNPAFDVFAVCVGDPEACVGNSPSNLYQTGVNTKPGQAPLGGAPHFNDGTFDHVFVDLSAYVGAGVKVFLLFDTISAPPSPKGVDGLEITQVRVVSNADDDDKDEGPSVVCDPCWDEDGDGYVHALSPGLPKGKCPNALKPDCVDTAAGINPDMPEICDTPADEDCDGLVNGQDPDCGTEDCANGVDDNGDGDVDCDDAWCVADAFCTNVCGQTWSFNTGGGGFVATDNDPDDEATTAVFQHGPTNTQGGGVGWATVLDGSVATAGSGRIQAWLSRSAGVPIDAPGPAIELKWRLEGDGTQDTFGVCFGVAPAACEAGGAAVVFSTTESTPSGETATAVVPIPPEYLGGSVDVVLFFDTQDGADNEHAGLFLEELIVRSDLDLDGEYELEDLQCDLCIDKDGDGYGAPDVAAVFVQDCDPTPVLDCDDAADGGALTVPGTPESCDLPGDQNCDGVLDPQDVSCSECGDGEVTAGESCDPPGGGCSAACELEVGGLHITELHVSKPLGLAGEQWFELYNPQAALIDVVGAGLAYENHFGQVELLSGCSVETPSIAGKGFYVVALGPKQAADGLVADAYCTGAVPLDSAGDRLTVRGGAGQVFDSVDFVGFGCELAQDAKQGAHRSLELMDPTGQSAGTNDGDGAWCVSSDHAPAAYSTSGKHFGSPGAAGTCAELVCDGEDDDCDGAVDEELLDTDEDGLCDLEDCDPEQASCTTDCTTDTDGDQLADCKDGCLDADQDGWGVPGGLPTPTCQTFAGEVVGDCDDTSSIVNPGALESSVQPASCTNGVDDDCDGAADCLAPGCFGTVECVGESCAGAQAVVCGDVVELAPETNAFECGTGADAVLRFVAPSTDSVTLEITNEGVRQYQLYVFPADCDHECADPELTVTTTCTQPGQQDLAVVGGSEYFLVVDQVADCAGATESDAATVRVLCAESCASELDDDGDGLTDCQDGDCVAAPGCASVDFDQDGASNGAELDCGTDPVDPNKTPAVDLVLDPDNDQLLNCVDPDDDNDGFSDSVEAAECGLNTGADAKNDATIYPGSAKSCDVPGLDADCNGTLDALEAACGSKETQCTDNLDNDSDGALDCDDADCVLLSPACAAGDFDEDGVSNGFELACGASPLDSNATPGPILAGDPDSDGVPSCVDTDDDGDGFHDDEELLCGSAPLDVTSVPKNTDGDEQCDAADDDDDGDGFSDKLEGDCGSDPLNAVSTPLILTFDLDQDGICDNKDADIDGDNWSNALEQACGTKILIKVDNPTDKGLDGDGDGLCDALDSDDDGDSWPDDKEVVCQTNKNDPLSVPPDADGDGQCDLFDLDSDGDTWPDALEDQCGTALLDPLSNPTVLGQDPDGDKLCNSVDSDDDNDQWNDALELECQSDPADAQSTPVDTDSDQLCDALDDDDDDDTWKDSAELACDSDPKDAQSVPADEDLDGQCDLVDPDADPDGDSWNNFQEETCGTLPKSADSTPVDTDFDTICDPLDDDIDGDGWANAIEEECGTDPLVEALHPVDSDGDSLCDAVDSDDDGDELPDVDEVLCGTDPLDDEDFPLEIDLADTDLDGAVNCVDSDDDGDEVPDDAEAAIGSNPLVQDSDQDGLMDGEENKDLDGEVDDDETSPVVKDSDGDGLQDGVEAMACYVLDDGEQCLGSEGWTVDTDGDGLGDGLEDANHNGKVDEGETNPLVGDSDSDGFDDGTEKGCAKDPLDAESVPVDKDSSGICDGAETDVDGDGVADGVEVFCGFDPESNASTPSLDDLEDLDGDTQINCVDPDDDDDAVLDVDELECNTGPRDADSTPSVVDLQDHDGDGLLNCSDDDIDNDGVSNEDETVNGTDAFDADTDDDGLSDGKEIFIEDTDPTSADTDGDGLQDGTEVGLTEGTPDTDPAVFQPDADPTTSTHPKNPDTDDDGVLDGDEDANQNGRKDEAEGDPQNSADGLKDTDGDGLTDRDEVFVYGTDPFNDDTDGDKLDDKLEVEVWGTEPLIPDTDGGGVLDGDEVEQGTIPTDPLDDYLRSELGGDTVFGCAEASTSQLPGLPALALLGLLALLTATLRRRQSRV